MTFLKLSATIPLRFSTTIAVVLQQLRSYFPQKDTTAVVFRTAVTRDKY